MISTMTSPPQHCPLLAGREPFTHPRARLRIPIHKLPGYLQEHRLICTGTTACTQFFHRSTATPQVRNHWLVIPLPNFWCNVVFRADNTTVSRIWDAHTDRDAKVDDRQTPPFCRHNHVLRLQIHVVNIVLVHEGYCCRATRVLRQPTASDRH